MRSINQSILTLALALIATQAGMPQDVHSPATAPRTSQTHPEPKPLANIDAPKGFSTFRADCFNIIPQQQQPVGAVTAVVQWNVIACPLPANSPYATPEQLKALTTTNAVSADELKTIAATANGNFTAVQQAVIDSIVKALNDQSVKADDIKSIVNAASKQIIDDVNARLKQMVETEVARQLKDASKR